MTSGSIANTGKCSLDLVTRGVVSITQASYGNFFRCRKVTIAMLDFLGLDPQFQAWSSVLGLIFSSLCSWSYTSQVLKLMTFRLALVARFPGVKVSLYSLHMETMKAPPSHMEALKPYLQVFCIGKSFLQITREQVTFLLVSYSMPSTKRPWSQLLSQNTNQIIITVIANDLWGLENHHGIIRGVLYLLYITVSTKSCQSQARRLSPLPTENWLGSFICIISLICLSNVEVT